jgi:hypothetical protein
MSFSRFGLSGFAVASLPGVARADGLTDELRLGVHDIGVRFGVKL